MRSTPTPIPRLQVMAAAILFVTAVLLAGCSTEQSRTQPGVQPADRSLDTTIGPLSLNETGTVGPYEVSMTKVRYAGGFLAMHVAVRNPRVGNSKDEALPLPAPNAFHLVNELGEVEDPRSVTWSRSEPMLRSPGATHRGVGGTLSTALRPGETLTLGPKFVVALHKPTRLTLYFTPDPSRPRLVVSFAVK